MILCKSDRAGTFQKAANYLLYFVFNISMGSYWVVLRCWTVILLRFNPLLDGNFFLLPTLDYTVSRFSLSLYPNSLKRNL